MKPKLKLLCIAPYPVEGASARLRVLQFFPSLRAAGIEATYRPFVDSHFFRQFYQPGRKLQKAMRLLLFALRRITDVQRATHFDVILVHREAAFFGPPVIESLIARHLKKPVVFDFDDAIHVPYVSPTYGRLASLVKYPQKVPQILRMSRSVVAGNRHLEDYASTLNRHVTLMPTVVDANVVRPRSRSSRSVNQDPIVLGWIGTHSTYPYLESLFPVLQEVAQQHPIILRVVGAGCDVKIPSVQVDNRRWSLDTELSDLQSFDIGLYPIIEDNWSLGKSGFKAVQYMAVGVPAVCSPVGATCDIVQDGVHGFLPSNPAEWVERLSLLIQDKLLRHKMGQAGRERVEEWYCLEKQAPRLQSALESVI
jgi:glycosyltransferase involved in cell wall biosynthesis